MSTIGAPATIELAGACAPRNKILDSCGTETKLKGLIQLQFGIVKFLQKCPVSASRPESKSIRI